MENVKGKYLYPQINRETGKPMHMVFIFKKDLEDGNIKAAIHSVLDDEREKFENLYRYDEEMELWVLK